MRNLSRQQNHTLKSDKKLNIFGWIVVTSVAGPTQPNSKRESAKWNEMGGKKKVNPHSKHSDGFLYVHNFFSSMYLSAFCRVLKGKITFTEKKQQQQQQQIVSISNILLAFCESSYFCSWW